MNQSGIWRFAAALVLACSGASVSAGEPVGASTPGTVRLMAVGDLSFAGQVGQTLVARGGVYPFGDVVDYFNQADIVMGNLECVVSRRGAPWPRKAIHMRAPLASANALVAGGFDLVTVANNHALDYGAPAFLDTMAALNQHHLGHVGGGSNYAAAHAPLILVRNGLRVAILGYVLPFFGPPHFNTRAWAAGSASPGLALGTPSVVAADVRAARQQADVVVVNVHGGNELHLQPNNKIRALADAAINAGAALVVGHHPHLLQGYHPGNHTLIAYSMGNFVFDPFDWFPTRTKDSAILDVTLGADGVESYRWIPVVVQDGAPRPAVGAEIPRILGEIPQI
jgi:poly-gamma-glutamate synthesis protein (capsule biosynthesis protein)